MNQLFPTATTNSTDNQFALTGAHQLAYELPATQKLFQATLDSSMDMIQVFEAVRNQQGQIVDFTWVLNNYAAEKVYGNVIGKSLLTINPGVVPEGIFEAFKHVVQTGRPQQYEKHYVHEQFDGWFYQSVVKLNDGVATTTVDITARKKAEQELQQQAHFIQSITDTASAIISITEFPSGATVFSNRDPYAKLGFDADELVKMKREDRMKLVHSDDVPKLTDYYTQFVTLSDTDEVRIEYRLKNRQGEWVWLDTRGKIFKRDRQGNVLQLLHVAQDITGRKKAEAQVLRLTEELAQKATDKYYSLFNSIDEGFCIQELLYDSRGHLMDLRITEANPAYERQTGLPKDVIGQLHSKLGLATDGYWFDLYDRIVKTGKPETVENWHEPTGRWYQASLSRIGAAGSRQLAVVLQDITERKRAEETLRQSEARYRLLSAELETRVNERTLALSQANADLQRSNDNLQTFAYVASHDLQEPLRKIQSFSTLLEQQLDAQLDESTRTYLQRIAAAGARMSMLIKDLLSYSRITTRQQSFEPVSLQAIVTGVLSVLDWEIEQSQARISLMELPLVNGDELQLSQLFQNLLTNALKFVVRGQVPQIWIEYGQRSLAELPAEVHPLRQTSVYHQISVRDAGVGFDPKFRDRIFQVFQRLHGKSEYAGSGVGLAICQRVVENHGGSITASSKPGEGATFHVYLPA